MDGPTKGGDTAEATLPILVMDGPTLGGEACEKRQQQQMAALRSDPWLLGGVPGQAVCEKLAGTHFECEKAGGEHEALFKRVEFAGPVCEQAAERREECEKTGDKHTGLAVWEQAAEDHETGEQAGGEHAGRTGGELVAGVLEAEHFRWRRACRSNWRRAGGWGV